MYTNLSFLLIISFAAFLSTLLGGLFALRLKDKLHLILGFSAGAVIGVAFFDLMPEALELAGETYSPLATTSIIALGFAFYLVLDRVVLSHTHTDETEKDEAGAHLRLGDVGAGTLSLHSLLDGIGIGLAFHVSPTMGSVVAVAVLAHDFSDGINTVNFVIKNKGDAKRAFKWLWVDALAPVLGIASTSFFSIPDQALGLLLALFAGFFLYIGASDLVPESHHTHPARWTTVATLLGMATLFLIIKLAS